MQTERVKEKIRKLLNLGNDAGAFEGEIDNALRFARRLMLQHNLTEADLAKPRDPHEAAADTEYGVTDAYSSTNHLCKWEQSLVWAVCGLMGTVQWYRASGETTKKTAAGTIHYGKHGRPIKAQRFTFYGPAEDTRDARELFEEWAHIIIAMARMKHGGAFKGDGRNYAEGFALGLREKVDELHRQERREIAAAPESSTALVLVGQHEIMKARKDRAAEWLKDVKGIFLVTGRGRGFSGSFNGEAFAGGKADGKKAAFQHARRKKLEG